MSFALEHEIVTIAWLDNASVQFPLNIYATIGFTGISTKFPTKFPTKVLRTLVLGTGSI